jgi:hypothetical protein
MEHGVLPSKFYPKRIRKTKSEITDKKRGNRKSMNTKIENGIIKSINFFSRALKIGIIYSIGGINRLLRTYTKT